jgi:Nif-specific regulatory protein
MQILSEYDWPGNIRELRNVIERAVVLAEDHKIQPTDIRFSSLSGTAEPNLRKSFEPITLERIEHEHIMHMLEWTKGKKREAARLLGINRSTLDRKLERYEIHVPARDE